MPASIKSKQAIYRLRQYFLASQAIKKAWLDTIGEDPQREPISDAFSPNDGADIAPHWHLVRHRFASVYTVIEGWRRLKLSDLHVNLALESLESHGHMKTLEAFRHSVYHFSPEAWDDRDRDFLAYALAEGAIDRVARLEDAFASFFDAWRARTDLMGIGHWQRSK